jgi:hypothetical protein
LVDCTTGGSISIISAWTIVVLIASVIAEVWSELEVSTISSALMNYVWNTSILSQFKIK